MWEHRKGGGNNEFGNNMRRLGDFATVEGFWRFYENIPRPSQMFTTEEGAKRFGDRELEAISVFKRGIRPEWEDPKNMMGGELFVRKTMSVNVLDQWWEDLLLACVGETLDPADVITGIRVIDKSQRGKMQYRVDVWFSCNRDSDPHLVDQIEEGLLATFGSNAVKFEYRAHSATLVGGGGGHGHHGGPSTPGGGGRGGSGGGGGGGGNFRGRR